MAQKPAATNGGVLVVGGQGLIGRALVEHFRAAGCGVRFTTRNPVEGSENAVHLDLRQPPDGTGFPVPASIAFLCAAVTDMTACENDPAATRAINVTHTLRAAELLSATGTKVIFLSSNQVFDGTMAAKHALDPTCPKSEYGRQKAAAERGILALGDASCVVRLTKVVAPGSSILDGWVEDLSRGDVIHPFSDMVMAPLTLPFTVAALSGISQLDRGGVFQVSAATDISYADAAGEIATGLGADPSLVQPACAARAGIPAAMRPAHTSLDTERLREKTGLCGPDPMEAVRAVVAFHGKTGTAAPDTDMTRKQR